MKLIKDLIYPKYEVRYVNNVNIIGNSISFDCLSVYYVTDNIPFLILKKIYAYKKSFIQEEILK